MKTDCSHCGHNFETSDNLATCPKCEQVFDVTPCAPRPVQPQPNEDNRQLRFWGGMTCVAIGLFTAPFIVGIPLLIFGCYVVKSAESGKT